MHSPEEPKDSPSCMSLGEAEAQLAPREAFQVDPLPTQPPSVIEMTSLAPGGISFGVLPQPDHFLFSPQIYCHPLSHVYVKAFTVEFLQ